MIMLFSHFCTLNLNKMISKIKTELPYKPIIKFLGIY